MTGPRASQVLQTPSARDLLSTILEDLLDGRNVVVSLPDGAETYSIWQALEHDLIKEHARPQYLTTSGGRDRSPVTMMSEALHATWPSLETPRTAGALQRILRADPTMPRVIAVTMIEHATPAEMSHWISFLDDWTAAASSTEDDAHDSVSLCYFLPASNVPNGVLRSDAFLAVHDWLGVPSALEMQLLVRTSSNRDQMTPRGVWREHMLPSLTGGDYQLIAHLWDAILLERADMDAALLAYADERKWDVQDLSVPRVSADSDRTQDTAPRTRPTSLSHEWRTLWQRGAVGWTPEYGMEISSALLILHQHHEQITHRIWRGQAALLLPQLDQLRLAVCQALASWFGPYWAVRWYEPPGVEERAAVQDNPMASQWGHITRILRASHERRDQCERLEPLAERARQIRNQIAHYRPIFFPTYNLLRQEIDRMQARGVIEL